MQTVTLSALRTKARRYADFVASGSAESVFSNADIDAIINEQCKEYYDKLVAVRGHEYFRSAATLSISQANGATYTLPATCYELITLTLEWDDANHELVPALNSLVERDVYQNLSVWDMGSVKCYRVYGDAVGGQSIEFVPAPGSSVMARLRYVPTFTELSDDADEIVAFNGWDKLIALGTAIEMRTIKGLPVAALAGQFERTERRIDQMAEDRLAAQPARVVDAGMTLPAWPVRRRFVYGGT